MKPRFSPILASTAIGLTALSTALSAAPLPDPPGMVVAPPEFHKTVRTLKVHNIPASTLAWLLDPQNNGTPAPIRISNRNRDLFDKQPPFASTSVSPTGTKPGILYPFNRALSALPPGVERLVAVDPQNAIMAFGSSAGLDELQTRVESLDKPLRQLEITARYVEIGSDAVKQLGLTPATEGMNSGPMSLGIAPADIGARIDDLVKQGKAKMITQPRVTAIDGLTASARTGESAPAAVGVRLEGKVRDQPEFQDSNLMVRQSIGLTVTPRITSMEANGGTIDLEMILGRILQLGDDQSNTDQAGWHRDLDGVQTVIGAQDGQTLAFMGADTRLFNHLTEKNHRSTNLLILVTPGIIRRAGE